jgi:hypothetical protein
MRWHKVTVSEETRIRKEAVMAYLKVLPNIRKKRDSGNPQEKNPWIVDLQNEIQTWSF